MQDLFIKIILVFDAEYVQQENARAEKNMKKSSSIRSPRSPRSSRPISRTKR